MSLVFLAETLAPLLDPFQFHMLLYYLTLFWEIPILETLVSLLPKHPPTTHLPEE